MSLSIRKKNVGNVSCFFNHSTPVVHQQQDLNIDADVNNYGSFLPPLLSDTPTSPVKHHVSFASSTDTYPPATAPTEAHPTQLAPTGSNPRLVAKIITQ